MKSIINSKLNCLAEAIPTMGYPKGSLITITYRNLVGRYDSREHNADLTKCGAFTLNISDDEYENMENIGGLLTYIYPNQQYYHTQKCWWYVGEGKKETFRLKKIDGYIHYGFHSKTETGAYLGGESRKKLEQIKPVNPLEIAKRKDSQIKAMNYMYGWEDSIGSGNCIPGTRAFGLKFKLKENKKYRGDFLLKLATIKAPSSIDYVKRMIDYRMNLLIQEN